MEAMLFVLFLSFLTALQDLRERKANSLFFILMWGATITFYSPFIFLVVFLIAWFVSWGFYYMNKNVAGFSDVLMAPVLYAFLDVASPFPIQFFLLTLLAAQVYALYTKKNVPYLAFAFVAMLSAFIYFIFF